MILEGDFRFRWPPPPLKMDILLKIGSSSSRNKSREGNMWDYTFFVHLNKTHMLQNQKQKGQYLRRREEGRKTLVMIDSPLIFREKILLISDFGCFYFLERILLLSRKGDGAWDNFTIERLKIYGYCILTTLCLCLSYQYFSLHKLSLCTLNISIWPHFSYSDQSIFFESLGL